MPQLVYQPQHTILEAAGVRWSPLIYGDQRADGTIEAWIEFRADDGTVRRTDRETTQPNWRAAEYWASGLEPVYFEGAFDRAASLPA